MLREINLRTQKGKKKKGRWKYLKTQVEEG
jgi:hypothetical protein